MSNEILTMEHISDHDLECYILSMVSDESELTKLEEHLFCCPPCVERAEETRNYVAAMRAAGIRADEEVSVMAEPINFQSPLLEIN